ncbi:MAG: tRNA (adenosine(37)-N6)-threonylcarbamoyltransferase complex ATPase subunit type 1 TsaE [Actinomycetota bacterium]|nr:tRNA (adenosine(37)-N6)-threonylcarbamoyltransferase complex ATPase subunit type 1 TsaE [Actinomycetota bacterium]
MELLLRTGTAEDTQAVGAAIAPLLRINDVMVLTGELGAGKTTLVRGIAKGLGADEHVASPTFTLVREYVSGRIPIAHVDVFRLDRIQDVVDLALNELEDGACVLIVEWGDVVEELLRDDRLRIELTTEDPTGDSEARRIVITSAGASWLERADELAAVTEPWSAEG